MTHISRWSIWFRDQIDISKCEIGRWVQPFRIYHYRRPERVYARPNEHLKRGFIVSNYINTGSGGWGLAAAPGGGRRNYLFDRSRPQEEPQSCGPPTKGIRIENYVMCPKRVWTLAALIEIRWPILWTHPFGEPRASSAPELMQSSDTDYILSCLSLSASIIAGKLKAVPFTVIYILALPPYYTLCLQFSNRALTSLSQNILLRVMLASAWKLIYRPNQIDCACKLNVLVA